MRTLAITRLGVGTLSLLFEPRDVWVGVYWTVEDAVGRHPPGASPALPYIERTLRVFVCLLPMLPIRYTRRLDALGVAEIRRWLQERKEARHA